jgi:hypothetical protein
VDCRTRRDGERLPSLRHLAASLPINSGLDIAAVGKLIGHSSIQLTSDTYGHMFDKAGREAAGMPPRGPLRWSTPLARARSLHFRAQAPRSEFTNDSPGADYRSDQADAWSGWRDLNPRPLDPQSCRSGCRSVLQRRSPCSQRRPVHLAHLVSWPLVRCV